MRKVFKVGLVVVASIFAVLAYAYLTLPDVRPLKTNNPSTTAFIELRAEEARAKGRQPRRTQRWVAYRQISPNLTRAVLTALEAGRAYVNVHTAKNPAGEVRGQIRAVPLTID